LYIIQIVTGNSLSLKNYNSSHSQLIQFIDAIVAYQQQGCPLTDTSEDVQWLVIQVWVLLPCSDHQCTSECCHDTKEVKEIKPIGRRKTSVKILKKKSNEITKKL